MPRILLTLFLAAAACSAEEVCNGCEDEQSLLSVQYGKLGQSQVDAEDGQSQLNSSSKETNASHYANLGQIKEHGRGIASNTTPVALKTGLFDSKLFPNSSKSLLLDSNFVEKTSFSSKSRSVFIAGLEGTLHHAWNDVWHACLGRGTHCKVEEQLMCKLYSNNETVPSLYNAFRSTDEEQLGLQNEIINLFRKSSSESNMLHILNSYEANKSEARSYEDTVRGCRHGMMSYPNYGGSNKVLQRPDMNLLARISEAAGVDLRIIVLLRPPEQILRSTVGRKFAPERMEAEILADNARVLYTQLMKIDPRFVACFGSDDRDTTMSNAQKLAMGAFLHEQFKATKEGQEAWLEFMSAIKPGKSHKAVERDTTYLHTAEGRLAEATSLLSSYCASNMRFLG